MRTYSLAIAVCAAACGRVAAPKPEPSPASASVTGRVIYTSRPDTLPPPDPGVVAAMERMDSINGLADTVVARPDSLLVHLGQTINSDTLIHIQCFRWSGDLVQPCGQFLDIEDRSVATFGEHGLTGLKVGRTRIVIRVMGKRAHAAWAYMPVRVVP